MTKRRTIWTIIPGTRARQAYSRSTRDGVAILCVRLSGYADNRSVWRITEALDALACSLTDLPDVATLDVTEFSNAEGDESSTLTSVFSGLPCCWISRAWDQQRDGLRWDLPPSGQMAASADEASARVASWRRAGGFSLALDAAASTRTWRWTERGLLVTNVWRGAPGTEDLWQQNRLVERTVHTPRTVHIHWPVPDRTGVTHEALRRQARIVVADGRIIEADFAAWSTGRPLPPDWFAHIADLADLETLNLRDTAAREPDILAAVQALPALHTLEVEPEALGPAARAQLRSERPGLTLR
ncbi:hypothetical protein [Nannocystis sp.]|uniref:hypothetical protein n=1 Tax=Nannocystis sp. TaxID=1962667 RepID=UPI0025EA5850|nr:hypothetical protein [Nannocystis sp.]MBK7826919.1 hypothetical protein [Nannocystis sp.]